MRSKIYLFFLPPPHKIISNGFELKKFKAFITVWDVNSDKVATESFKLKLLNGARLKSFTSKDLGGGKS